jgi:hypothetical protein
LKIEVFQFHFVLLSFMYLLIYFIIVLGLRCDIYKSFHIISELNWTWFLFPFG